MGKLPVKNKEEIFARILEAKGALLSLGVSQMGLFGSFVRDAQNDLSDVDILVEFYPFAHSFDNFMDLSFLLEEMLGRKVELITADSLSPHIAPHIMREVRNVRLAA